MHDDQMMAWAMKDAAQIIREMLESFGIPAEDLQTPMPFQGQVIDSTAIVLDETQRMLPAPVPNNATL